MPEVGSQLILCDVPIRFDTYTGCSHACAYCFANRKRDISQVSKGESPEVLKRFIKGERAANLRWCDWDIPLHWGGMSDPFQPIEKTMKRSLECLEIFAETQYPFIVSTKNKLIAEEPYLSLIKQCNVVVQFSALSPRYDNIERGASTFAERMEAAANISPFKRVNIRCQPYVIELFDDILNEIDMFKEIGVHGVIFEGMKGLKKMDGMVQMGVDFVYPSATLKEHFKVFKAALHERGMKFYCGENRLRGMSDELCCCGIEGMGWLENKANLNHYIYDRNNFRYTDKMLEVESGKAFNSMSQTTLGHKYVNTRTYKEIMDLSTKSATHINMLVPDEKQFKK